VSTRDTDTEDPPDIYKKKLFFGIRILVEES
jgi:hypothetical protein